MRLFWKIAIPVSCAALIGGAAALWFMYKAKTNERKLADEARVCLQRAQQGDAKAECDLGQMYFNGRGVPRDYAEVLRWERKAADQGYARAEYEIGYMFSHGLGVQQDKAEAARWYRKAADQGYALAESVIGYMSYHGHGVPLDYAEALNWFHKAADQGDTFAENELGRMYYQGQGVPQDSAEAARWYRKAADQGYAPAESNIGFLTYYGYGVPQDKAEANRWFRKAADQGDEYALSSISYGLTTSRKVFLWAKLIGGLFFALSFLSLNSFEPSKSLRDFRQRVNTGTGVLILLSAGLGWYGYTHYKIRYLHCGWNAFTWTYWLLNGVLITFLFILCYLGRSLGKSSRRLEWKSPRRAAGVRRASKWMCPPSLSHLPTEGGAGRLKR